MKKTLFFTVFCLLTAVPAYAGQIQISTYYPSPFGYYERLKFNPRLALTEPCEVGTVYYLSGTGLKYCAEDTTWKNVGGSVWNQLNDNISPIDTAINPNLQIGIGTDAPTSSLHVYAPEGYTPAGVFLDDADIEVDGGVDGEFMIKNSSGSGTQRIFLTGTSGVAPVLTVDGVAQNVGIGTTTPGIRLSVYDTVTTVGKPLLFLGAPSLADNEAIGMWLGRTGSTDESAYILYRHDTITAERNLQLGHIGSAPKLVIENSGNIGIGTTSPLESLHIKDASSVLRLERTNNANRNMVYFYPAGAIASGNAIWGMGLPAAANYFSIGYDTDITPPGTFVLNITDTGNVGIGTTAPDTTLHIKSASNVTPLVVEVNNPYAAMEIRGSITSGRIGVTSPPSGNEILFDAGSNGIEEVVIKETGNVGIGTTDPGTNRLEVVGGPIKATGGLIIETRTTNPGAPVAGQMWLCTDTGDATPCNGI